jgi:hypothetical protein
MRGKAAFARRKGVDMEPAGATRANHRLSVRQGAFGAVALLFAGASLVLGYSAFGNGYGNKWGDPNFGTSAVVSWGFMADGTGVDPGFRIDPFSYPNISGVTGTSNITQLRSTVDATYGTGAFDAAIQHAINTWAAAANIILIGPIPDSGLPVNDPAATTPDIRIGAFMPNPNHSFASTPAVGFAPPYNGGTLAGDILFNLSLPLQILTGTEDVTAVNYFYGNDVEELVLHELGHAAIGLAHPYPNDPHTDVLSVMYVGAGCCGYLNHQLAPDDIAGARYVYGPPVVKVLGDVDGDGHVDVLDLLYLVDAFGKYWGQAGYNPACDFNHDGAVDVGDLLDLVYNFGT